MCSRFDHHQDSTVVFKRSLKGIVFMWNLKTCGFWEMFIFVCGKQDSVLSRDPWRSCWIWRLDPKGFARDSTSRGHRNWSLVNTPKWYVKQTPCFTPQYEYLDVWDGFFKFSSLPIGPQNRAPFYCFWALWQMMDDDGSWWWMCLFCLSVRRPLPMMRPTPDVENLYVPTIPVFGF